MSASPRRSVLYAQNFLKSPCLVSALLDSCDIGSDDVVYEIGPGKGILTEQLAHRYKHVVAVEKDPRLVDQLLRRFAGSSNVTIHQGDFLEFRLPRSPYKVVANIPFNITAALVTRLTAAENPPEDAYLVMQREAAEMYVGQPRESLRSILLKPWFEMQIVHDFRREDFEPAPRVDVVMLRMRKRGPPLVRSIDSQCFRDFIVYLFSAWRPTMDAALTGIFTRQQRKHIQKNLDIDLAGTPTSIAFEQWLELFAYFKTVSDARGMRMVAGSERRLLQQQTRLQKVHRTRSRKKCTPQHATDRSDNRTRPR